MANNARLRARVSEIQAQKPAEREWWDQRRETLRAQFMKELDVEENHAPKLDQAPSVASAGSHGSDEEAVLVEGGGPTSPTTPGGKKKKKGKK